MIILTYIQTLEHRTLNRIISRSNPYVNTSEL